MFAEVKHLLQKCRNAILFILVLLTLPILLFIFFHSNIGYKLLITIFILLFEIHIIYILGTFYSKYILIKLPHSKMKAFVGVMTINIQWF